MKISAERVIFSIICLMYQKEIVEYHDVVSKFRSAITLPSGTVIECYDLARISQDIVSESTFSLRQSYPRVRAPLLEVEIPYLEREIDILYKFNKTYIDMVNFLSGIFVHTHNVTDAFSIFPKEIRKEFIQTVITEPYLVEAMEAIPEPVEGTTLYALANSTYFQQEIDKYLAKELLG